MKIKRILFFNVCFLCCLFMNALFAQAQNIHVILATDLSQLSDGGLLKSIICDSENITQFFKKNVPQDKLKLYQVNSHRVTPENIIAKIKEVQANKDDTVVFYYSGHAANDGFNGGHYFQLVDKDGKDTSIARAEVLNKLIDLNAHLTILLTDCCNIHQQRNIKKDASAGSTRGSSDLPSQFSPVIKKLFIDQEGVVDMTTSCPDQSSFGTKDGTGSIGTICWVELWNNYNDMFKENPNLSKDWQKFLDDSIPMFDKLFQETFKGTATTQTTQTPYAYDLPGRPRFGIRAQTLGTGIGNVVILEVAPNMPGDKAGLKVNDIIIRINNKEILDENDYDKAIDESPKKAIINFKRDNKELEVIATLNGMPKTNRVNFGKIGLVIEELSVKEVVADKPAFNAGMKEKDIIVKINNNEIKKAEDIIAAIDSIKDEDMIINITFTREGKENSLAIFTGNYPKGTPVVGINMRGNNNKVYKVIKGSPADRAGIKENCRVIKFNGKDVSNGTQFGKLIDAAVKKKQAKVVIVIQKVDKETEELNLILNLAASLNRGGRAHDKDAPMFGAALNSNSNKIVKIVEGSPAEEAGLEVNDVILKINNQKITNGKEFGEAVEKANSAKQARVELWIRKATTNVEEDAIVTMNLKEVKKETKKEDASDNKEEAPAGNSGAAAEEPSDNSEAAAEELASSQTSNEEMAADSSEESPLESNADESESQTPVFGASMSSENNKIVKIVEGSPAHEVDLQVGDSIIKINNTVINNGNDFSSAIDASPQTAQLVIRTKDGQEKSVVVHLNK